MFNAARTGAIACGNGVASGTGAGDLRLDRCREHGHNSNARRNTIIQTSHEILVFITI